MGRSREVAAKRQAVSASRAARPEAEGLEPATNGSWARKVSYAPIAVISRLLRMFPEADIGARRASTSDNDPLPTPPWAGAQKALAVNSCLGAF